MLVKVCLLFRPGELIVLPGVPDCRVSAATRIVRFDGSAISLGSRKRALPDASALPAIFKSGFSALLAEWMIFRTLRAASWGPPTASPSPGV